MRYLLTKLGLTTPPVVAERMLSLAPESIGLSGNADTAEIHVVRTTLEDIARGRGELEPAEHTGTYLRPGLAATRTDKPVRALGRAV